MIEDNIDKIMALIESGESEWCDIDAKTGVIVAHRGLNRAHQNETKESYSSSKKELLAKLDETQDCHRETLKTALEIASKRDDYNNATVHIFSSGKDNKRWHIWLNDEFDWIAEAFATSLAHTIKNPYYQSLTKPTNHVINNDNNVEYNSYRIASGREVEYHVKRMLGIYKAPEPYCEFCAHCENPKQWKKDNGYDNDEDFDEEDD